MALFMNPAGLETPEAFDARANNGSLTWKDFVDFSCSTHSTPGEQPAALSGLSPIYFETLGDNTFRYQFSEKDAKELLHRYYSDEENGM
jgi:hypothetical protein